MDITQSIENIMDGIYYQRGSIKEDGNMQRNHATIQDERKIQYLGHLVRHNTSQLGLLIEGKIDNQVLPTKYYQPKRAAEDRKRWHGLVVNLAQETTLWRGKQHYYRTVC